MFVCKIPLLARRTRPCMQDTFARATHSAARPSARATIGYLVYNTRPKGHARDDRVSCIQSECPGDFENEIYKNLWISEKIHEIYESHIGYLVLYYVYNLLMCNCIA